jgi:hypothetical protein
MPSHRIELALKFVRIAGFKTGNTDDPEVFLYEECDESFKRVANSFSEWFAGCVEDEIAAAKELKGS